MTTTTKTLDPKSDDNKDPKNDNKGLIDTTTTGKTEPSKQDEGKDTASSDQAKLDKNALLEKAKAKTQVNDADNQPQAHGGLVPVHIPYPGTNLPTEKITLEGRQAHVVRVFINGKEYIIETNKHKMVPSDVAEALNNTTHHGGARVTGNEPTIL